MRFRAGFAEAIAVGLLSASAVGVGLSAGSNACAADYELDSKSVSRGQTTAVLIHFEAIFNGQPRKVDTTLYQPMPYLANMDRGEAPVRVPLTASYRVKGAGDGWVAWGLQPGTYFLLVRPTGWPGSPPSSFYDPVRNTYRLVTRDGDAAGSAELPGFWFVVPPGTPALYLGTLTMDCRGKENYFIVNADHCNDLVVRQEPERAGAIAATLLRGVTNAVSAELTRYGTRRAMPQIASEPAIMDLDIKGAGGLSSAEFAAHGGLPLVMAIGPNPSGVVVFDLLSLIVQQASVAKARSDAEKAAAAAQPCMDALSARLGTFDLGASVSAAFGRSMGERLHSPSGTNAAAVAAANEGSTGSAASEVLSASVERIHLRECREHETLCVEIAMRLRLSERATGAVLLDERLAYAGPYPQSDPMPFGSRIYERTVAPNSLCTALADWCGSDGPQFLVTEIERGLQAIATQFAHDVAAP
jgi:hypothetical protein